MFLTPHGAGIRELPAVQLCGHQRPQLGRRPQRVLRAKLGRAEHRGQVGNPAPLDGQPSGAAQGFC